MADKSIGEQIHVKLGQEREVPTRFKIKRFMPLQKLFNAYAERLGIQTTLLRFYHDGNRLHDTDTPAGVGMEEDDLIDVQQNTVGGGLH